MASRKRSILNDADALYKEWDEASCPICMDHPHNAVLLLCTSHDKGCRSYICDTSYRHSNCLDRFRKLRDENSSFSLYHTNQHNMVNASVGNLGSRSSGDQTEAQGDHDIMLVDSVATEELGQSGSQAADNNLEIQETTLEVRWEAGGLDVNNMENSSESMSNLKCPLCRGRVLGWKVVEEARSYLNLKHRSCSHESCSFFGNYRELRRHARRVHPTTRPADIDPSRQHAWQRLEDQREYDDNISAIRSAVPGAVVLGDYVIENGDGFSADRDRGSDSSWFSTFFLFEMIGSVDPGIDTRGGRSRAFSRHHRSTGALSRRRFLWGENLLGTFGLNITCAGSTRIAQIIPRIPSFKYTSSPHSSGYAHEITPRRFILCSKVVFVATQRAPVAPTGCPRAMAPPLTLTFWGQAPVSYSSIYTVMQMPEYSKNWKPLLHCQAPLHEKHCSSTITCLTRIPSSCSPIFPECRFQFSQICQVSVWPNAIIKRNCNRLFFSGFRVDYLGINRDDFIFDQMQLLLQHKQPGLVLVV